MTKTANKIVCIVVTSLLAAPIAFADDVPTTDVDPEFDAIQDFCGGILDCACSR
jgi:hypothetical protein